MISYLIFQESTVKVIYSYHPDDPTSFSSLPWHGAERRGTKSLMLLTSVKANEYVPPSDAEQFDMLYHNVRHITAFFKYENKHGLNFINITLTLSHFVRLVCILLWKTRWIRSCSAIVVKKHFSFIIISPICETNKLVTVSVYCILLK